MKNNQIQITWSQAEQLHIDQKVKDKKQAKKHRRNIERANLQFLESLGSNDFRMSDFEQACIDNGIDQDDLLNRLI